MDETYIISLSREDIKKLWKKIKKNKDLEKVNIRITIPDKKLALDLVPDNSQKAKIIQ